MRAALALFSALLLSLPALASPSAFPETALSIYGGYQGRPSFRVGGELMVPVRFLDVSVGADVVIGTAGAFAVRLSTTGLVFPSVGTVPPLALGLGSDVGYQNGGLVAHLGVVVGSDLLFVSDLPATLSLYLAPGITFGQGFSLAWEAEARYYFGRVALVLSSSDLMLIALGLRVPF